MMPLLSPTPVRYSSFNQSSELISSRPMAACTRIRSMSTAVRARWANEKVKSGQWRRDGVDRWSRKGKEPLDGVCCTVCSCHEAVRSLGMCHAASPKRRFRRWMISRRISGPSFRRRNAGSYHEAGRVSEMCDWYLSALVSAHVVSSAEKSRRRTRHA